MVWQNELLFSGDMLKTLVFSRRAYMNKRTHLIVYKSLNKCAHFMRLSEHVHHRVQLGGYIRGQLVTLGFCIIFLRQFLIQWYVCLGSLEPVGSGIVSGFTLSGLRAQKHVSKQRFTSHRGYGRLSACLAVNKTLTNKLFLGQLINLNLIADTHILETNVQKSLS